MNDPSKLGKKTGKTNYVQIHVIGISCISYFVLCMHVWIFFREIVYESQVFRFFTLAEKIFRQVNIQLLSNLFLWHTVRKMGTETRSQSTMLQNFSKWEDKLLKLEIKSSFSNSLLFFIVAQNGLIVIGKC